ncbi:type I restriction endonuclease subunit R [Halogeometricum sp. S1BR25-6]|uniref:type I site-specific deoxyribonuclease n=1 Tax=Halogeometricum salsisoli TaxID=2950536 RepID=A0ABU2GEY1_9EURY|nr:type I restriction endonuclease subunit R [Halogeometricum sp. S1BR25-6]MDS0299365.1 type I restriction endonuclease subunit R [Halogeometricum sp. S1BR25-6]
MSDEYTETERPALTVLHQLGWKVADQQRSTWLDPRETESSAVLENRLRDAVERLNPWIDENNLNKVVREIQQIGGASAMDENEQIHEKLVRHTSVQQDRGHGLKHQTVRYIDYEDPENNDFFALNQFRVEGPIEVVKPDIVLFVNGLPLGVIECKAPTIAEPRSEALEQLQRYQNEREETGSEGAEELFRYNQFSVATWYEGAVMGTYGTPRNQYKPWRDAYPADDEHLSGLFGTDYVSPQHRMLYALFEPSRLLDQLRHFTVYDTKKSGTAKLVARYQQYRAVEKALEQINHRGSREAQGGVIWHTQGSGKSLTMLFLALKLRRAKSDPTLLLVTDRRSLDKQIHGTFERCGFPNPKRAGDIKDLREKLKNNAGETITSLIQKFQLRDDEEGDFPVLSRDDDIYVMVDEAHRTQYKSLANNMRTALPEAYYIGFTGTPIEKEERDTRRTFGTYIDTYTIDQSLEDDTTVEILYQGRLADIHLEGADLDVIFDRVFDEYTEEEKAEIKKRYAREQDLAEAESRIERVALDVIEHFENEIARPFKGMVVTTSKRAAIRYKKKLDQFNGPESRVVISKAHNDPEDVKKWAPTDSELRDYKESFVDDNGDVELLIVCDMLLTGFDAPIAQAMYLDKPLKEHNLLQAIARVNRPYAEKNHGIIIDYYGVSDDLREALAMFSEEDVRHAMVPLEDKEPELEASHRKAISFFDDLDDVEACLRTLEPDDVRIEFQNAFKRFSKLMDIVLPNPLANPYKEDLNRLSEIHARAKQRYRDDSMNLEGCGEKVRELIQEHLSSSGIEVLNEEPVSVMDKSEFDTRLDKMDDDEARASEMQNAVKHELSVRYDEDPVHFSSLRERVEELIEEYRQKRLSDKQIIEELRDVLDDMRSRNRAAQKKGLNDTTELSFYHALEDVLRGDNRDVGEDQLLELTSEIIDEVEKLARVVEWKQKVHVQDRMRKQVKIQLFRSDIDLSSDERDELTNRVIELARAHYE